MDFRWTSPATWPISIIPGRPMNREPLSAALVCSAPERLLTCARPEALQSWAADGATNVAAPTAFAGRLLAREGDLLLASQPRRLAGRPDGRKEQSRVLERSLRADLQSADKSITPIWSPLLAARSSINSRNLRPSLGRPATWLRLWPLREFLGRH